MRQNGSSIDAHTQYKNLGLTQVVVVEEAVQVHGKAKKEVQGVLSSGQRGWVAVEAAEGRSYFLPKFLQNWREILAIVLLFSYQKTGGHSAGLCLTSASTLCYCQRSVRRASLRITS